MTSWRINWPGVAKTLFWVFLVVMALGVWRWLLVSIANAI
jgi:hypothetical protein